MEVNKLFQPLPQATTAAGYKPAAMNVMPTMSTLFHRSRRDRQTR
jgi:hypothetical protein